MLNDATSAPVIGAETSSEIPQDDPPRSALEEALAEMTATRTADSPRTLPDVLPLDHLSEKPEAFVLRSGEREEYHLNELAVMLKAKGDLDPITVYPCGNDVFVVDGHYRLEAYRRAGRKTIRITTFSGTPQEARAFAIEKGCRVSRPLTTQERMNAAWQNLLSGAYSQRANARMTAVSTTSIEIMSKARRVLGDTAFVHHEWWAAREAAENAEREAWEPMTDEEELEADRERGSEFARRIRKEFGPALQKNARIAAFAIHGYLGFKTEEMVVHLHQQKLVGEVVEEEEHPLF